MLRSRSHASLLLGVGLFVARPSEVGAQEPALPDQVLVLRAPASTRVSVEHIDGDRVALLRIERPPTGAIETLTKQRGPLVDSVEHLLLEGEVLTLLLRLSTDAVQVEARSLGKGGGWSVALTPRSKPVFPEPGRVVAGLPAIEEPPLRPALFPSPPVDPPCAGRPEARAALATLSVELSSALDLDERLELLDDPMCRDWAASLFAEEALASGRSLDPFERWAFAFSFQSADWSLHPEARARISLVAAEVLSRLDYMPEARALLADAPRYSRHHALARVMTLANHFALLRARDEAETLYRQLVAEGFDPWVIHRASLARAMNALEGEDPRGALAHVERAARLLPRYETLPGDLWIVGGEAALAAGELDLARAHFDRAARSSTRPDRAFGLLRLADLDLRAGRDSSALQGWGLADSLQVPCMADLVRLRRIIAVEIDRAEATRLLDAQSRFSRCAAVRMEAHYALNQIHLHQGDDTLALEQGLAAATASVERWGTPLPARALVTSTLREIVARMARQREPARLVEVFERDLERHRALLDPATRFEVARAYDAIETSPRGAYEMLDLLLREDGLDFREELVMSLGEALLRGKDIYRAELVLRHHEERYGRTPLAWRHDRLAARLALVGGRPKDALALLERASPLAPAGDRRAELALEAAKAHLALGQAERASRSLVEAAKAGTLEASTLAPTVIAALSECARGCSSELLRATAPALVSRVGRAALSPRLITHLTERGALPKEPNPSPNDPTSALWSRLQAVGVQGPRSDRGEMEEP